MLDYFDKDFDLDNIESKIKEVNNMFKLINNSIETYKKKYTSINDKMNMLNNKTNLNLDNTTNLLKFQNLLILNEIKYLNSLKQIVSVRLNTELYNLSEKLTFISISIINLNKDINQDHINQIKKVEKNSSIDTYIEIILDNFSNIKQLLLKLKDYGENINNEMTQGNFHCGTLNIDLTTKRIHIFLEYKKIVNYFYTIVNYFSEIAENINNNLDNTSIFNFLVAENISNNVKDNIDDAWSLNEEDLELDIKN